ncbi:MAG: hypothetical protein GXO60_03590 [Epsilonproteobacteria bacterium]|nr:hypothetical protein [Campylobacterota bacterium]
MKRTLLVFLGISNLLLASEFDYGNGTFSMEGGFLGLNNKIDTDVSTYSLVTRHANMFGNFFYAYDLNWYDSDTLKQNQYTYNNLASNTNELLNNDATNNSGLTIPAMNYTLQGLDANIKIGYDVWHQDKDNFLGLGAIVGISLPWIDSTKSDSNDDNSDDDDLLGEFPDTKTTIRTYKIGATVNFQKSLISNKLSIYGLGSYAYQTGDIDNDYLDSSYSVDGTFQEYNIGLYFTPFTEEFKWGFLTLSPRIYATIGYKYSKWTVDDMTINMSGKEVSSDILDPLATEFTMDSSIGYFGLGYSF